MTLTEFLTARLDEDEVSARRGSSEPVYRHFGDTAAEECAAMAQNEGCSDDGVAFIMRWIPGRVLAEVEAKRRLMELALYWDEDPNDYGQMREVLQILALPYADHPDYDEAWRP